VVETTFERLIQLRRLKNPGPALAWVFVRRPPEQTGPGARVLLFGFRDSTGHTPTGPPTKTILSRCLVRGNFLETNFSSDVFWASPLGSIFPSQNQVRFLPFPFQKSIHTGSVGDNRFCQRGVCWTGNIPKNALYTACLNLLWLS